MPHRIIQQHNLFLDFLYIPLIPLFAYLDLDIDGMAILGALLFIDFLSGISKSYVVKIPITYERAVAGIISKVFVLVIPISLALMAKVVVHFNMGTYLNYIVSSLVIAECYSILGNAVEIRTKNRTKQDIISIIIRGIREFMEKVLLGFREDK